MTAGDPVVAPVPRTVRAAAMPDGTPHVPVAIVGAGACGLTAAMALRDAGIDCLLLERDAQLRGSTALSSGFIPAAGSSKSKTLGFVAKALAISSLLCSP